MPANRADICAIHVDADRHAVVVGVRDAMYITYGRRDSVHHTGLQAFHTAFYQRHAVAAALVPLAQLGAAQHPYQAPYGMVVNGRMLAGPPHKTHNRKAAGRTAVQQKLLVMPGMGHGVRRFEPFHFSPRYDGEEERMIDEAMQAFCGEDQDAPAPEDAGALVT